MHESLTAHVPFCMLQVLLAPKVNGTDCSGPWWKILPLEV